MKVTTKLPEPAKPNVVIELTWEEAVSLRKNLVTGYGIIDELYAVLRSVTGGH